MSPGATFPARLVDGDLAADPVHPARAGGHHMGVEVVTGTCNSGGFVFTMDSLLMPQSSPDVANGAGSRNRSRTL